MSQHLTRFQELLREFFQFDCADLDFGIYRIMNHKRDVIEDFITQDLPGAISEELERGALAEQARAIGELEIARQKVLEISDDAIDPEGNLIKYHDTKPGKEYLAVREKATSARDHEALRVAVYNHLHAFFNRYWQDGDFISKRRYSKRERYAIPYSGEEVALYWANRDQYYIKTGEHFTDYSWKASGGVTVHFKLIAADVEQGNVKGEKRFFLPRLDQIGWNEPDKDLSIPFEYRPLSTQETVTYGSRNQQEAIIIKAAESIPRQDCVKMATTALAALGIEKRRADDGRIVTHLEHHLRRYTQRNTSDFFIHKDLKGFLSRELDFYLKNEVLNLEEMESAGEALSEGWFQMMRLIKRVGGHIIEFLTQIEEFQKMLWEKRKFITETFYCITMGHIPEKFYSEIAACEAQWTEWKALFHIDEEEENLFTAGKGKDHRRLELLKFHPTLVLDTRHFSRDFTDRLLASFDDLEEATDGLLVHSENWQALNLLAEKYRERVKSIYIDPPYNTDASPIIYKNDYRSSTWIAMMNDRINLSRLYLEPKGMIATAIDDFQQRELHFLLETLFGKKNLLGTVVVRSNPSGRPGKTGFSTSHEYVIFAAQLQDTAVKKLERTDRHNRRYKHMDAKGSYMWELLRKRGSGSERKDSPRLYYPFYVGPNYIRLPKMKWDEDKREWIIQEDPKQGEMVAYPIDEDGIHRRWRWSVENAESNISELRPIIKKEGFITIYYKYRPPHGILPTTLWIDAKYSATEHGTNVLKSFFQEYDPFSFPKSIYTTLDALIVMGMNSPQSCCLDYFAGSGTTGHAVINLNREDGGQRKFILVEMARHFDTVMLPRIKKVTYSPEWKDGRPRRMATSEEAAHSPRIVKVIRLESYEDALNNIAFDESTGQLAMEFEDYLLQYMLHWETRKSETLLNVEKLTKPFSYKLRIHGGSAGQTGGETGVLTVDLPETFAYLLGLSVQKRQVLDDNGRRYLVYKGTTRNGRKAAVIWRETEGWGAEDYKGDQEFVSKNKLTGGIDDVYVNGDSYISGAQALERLFKEKMFAPVGV